MFAQEVTLKNLIDNIYLENYKNIEIYKTDTSICAELTCRVNDSKKGMVTYTYDFSPVSGLLMRLRQIVVGEIAYETLYDRVKEYKKLTGNDWDKVRASIMKDTREKKS